MSSRGQSEVLGLLVIVVLLAVLSLIALRFLLSSQPSLYPEVRRHSEATALVSSVMKTTVHDSSLMDLAVLCSSDSSRCSDLDVAVQEIFSAVLRPHEDYLFTLSVEAEEIYRGGGCAKGIRVTYPFVRQSLSFESSLILCSRNP